MTTTAADKLHVAENFEPVAHRYDLLQRLNPGYHKHLRMSAKRLGAPPTGRILDLCCGTGLSTEALAATYPRAEITALDASANMLTRAKQKRSLGKVDFICGDAMDPAAVGVKGPFDAILMAYGIRNVPDADTTLANIRKLLWSAQSTVVFHEYSVAGAWLPTALWRVVSSTIIVPLGEAVTGSGELFRYLRQSVLDFDSVRAFEARLGRAGFSGIETLPMNGWQRGIVHSFRARKGTA